MSYNNIEANFQSFNLKYNNLKRVIEENKNYLLPEQIIKVDKYEKFADLIKNLYTSYYNQQTLNTTSLISRFIFLLNFVGNIFDSLSARILSWAKLPADCRDVIDYRLQIVTENNIRKLVRISDSKPTCKIFILEETGEEVITSYDPTTSKINTEIIMSTIRAENLLYQFTAEELEIIKDYISIVTGINKSLITNIDMIDLKDGKIILSTSFNPTFTNTIQSAIKTAYSINNPVSVTVKLISVKNNLPSTYDYNIRYIQNIINNSTHIYK